MDQIFRFGFGSDFGFRISDYGFYAQAYQKHITGVNDDIITQIITPMFNRMFVPLLSEPYSSHVSHEPRLTFIRSRRRRIQMGELELIEPKTLLIPTRA